MIPQTYRALLGDRRAQRLMSGLGVSALGDALSTVTIAWLAVRTAPAGEIGLFVGLAVAAYTLPGAAGAFAFGRHLRRRPARSLVLANCLLRACFLGTVAVLAGIGALSPIAYVALLAGSSLLPFAFAPAAVTLVSFAVGGLVYGPFIPLTYALFQSITTTANLPSVLAARSAALLVAAPLGTAIGGPIVAGLGAAWTLAASGAATILLAVLATAVWRPHHSRRHARVDVLLGHPLETR